jgi:hypothetical protein
VAVNPQTQQLLAREGVSLSPVAPATAKTALVFPISGGRVAVATLAGTIEQTGGVKLSHGNRSVELTNFVLDTATKQVTALVGGLRIPIMDLNLSSVRRASGTNGALLASNIALTVTAQAASSLNTLLGVSGFQGGQLFGVASLTVAAKA